MPEQKDAARGLLATIAITAGVVAFGAYALDLHAHTCANCGHKWRHLGAFNLGDEESHTCARCGQVQWWKCGAPHVLQGSQFAGSASPAYGRTLPSLPYERVGYERSYERPSLGAAYQEVPDCEFPPYEGYGQLASSRLHEETSPYRTYVRRPSSRGHEELSPHRGYTRVQQYERLPPSQPYEHRSPNQSYEYLPSDPPYERRPPSQLYERRMYQQAPSRLTYGRQASGRAYGSLMSGTGDQDECR